MKTINKFKIALVTVGMLTIGSVNAQRDAAAVTAGAAANFDKEPNTVLGNAGGSVKVVDNKGTIKYLQANNGLTVFTDTAPNGGVVTTWQLGGTLTDDTYIDAGGAEFGITGIDLIDTTTGNPEDTAAAAADINTQGYTFMVRDEATGEIKKLLASDIVTAIRVEYPVTGANVTATGKENIPVAGLPLIDNTNNQKLFVFRNGVKLRYDTDFVAASAAGSFDMNISTDLPLYIGDIIEIQYIK